MGQVPSVGDEVVIEADVKKLQAAVEQKPDDLEWDAAEYGRAAGKAGIVRAVEGGEHGVADIAVDGAGVISVPVQTLRRRNPPPPAPKPDHPASASPPSVPEPGTPDSEPPSLCAPLHPPTTPLRPFTAAAPPGAPVAVEPDAARLRTLVLQHPEDLEWEEATAAHAGKRGKVVQTDPAGFADVAIDGVLVTLPLTALRQVVVVNLVSESPIRKRPAALKRESTPEQLGLQVGCAVLVVPDAGTLRRLVEMRPDDLDWDPEVYLPAAGARGVVTGVDDGIADVDVTVKTGGVQSVCLPTGALTQTEHSFSRTGSVSTPVASPRTPAASKQQQQQQRAGGVQLGAVVTVEADEHRLRALVAQHSDDLEWDPAVYRPALGATGTVVGVDGGVADVSLGGESVSIPFAALTPGRGAGAAKAAKAAVLGPGSSVVVDESLAALERAVKKYPDDLGWDVSLYGPATGVRGVVVELEGDLRDVQLSTTGHIVTLPTCSLRLANPVSPPPIVAPPPRPVAPPPGPKPAAPVDLKPAQCVLICKDEQVLRAMVAQDPTLQWEAKYADICGKFASVARTEAGVTLVRLEGRAINLPTHALIPCDPPEASSAREQPPDPVLRPKKKTTNHCCCLQ
ncbi:hypothetical protein DIPPA_30333 [Diplonema papillatum]|nr:hypothetical protein DIPPA_30333 [Diplonema papillatum]